MPIAVGLIALVFVAVLYLFVSSGGILWPGGPQLQPEGARNLSIALIFVALLICGVMFGGAAQTFGSLAGRGRATQIAQLTETAGGTSIGEATAITRAAPDSEATPGTPVDFAPTLALDRTATATIAALDATATATIIALDQTSTPPRTAAPSTPTDTPTPGVSPSLAPTDTPTLEPSQTPTPTASALPLDPRALVETVLENIIPRANDAQVAAILSGDESRVDPLWSRQARERVIENVRRLRSRFVEVTEVTWQRTGNGIQLVSSTVTTATYITSETWTFIGTIAQRCPDGSAKIRRYVETYPEEQYMLQLQSGAYRIVEWRLGRPILNEVRIINCP